ncbi:DNA replication factor RFC1 [Fadolivirus algeromassiliense]|jgi:DNA polymerase III delta prime subunit|uniref:DNA replication factor RFC1 n=1 Tax=Fadolivirus FV1/VV64 TaxID=3070911 RepID=A0A7D3V7H3_9VIRU|nr:DNA replication factor RFC1 [Fadolivirus algeromassiliense]QKF93876.1 DNA replication factor RFC1 [Fadolivirus FV1/VV64]
MTSNDKYMWTEIYKPKKVSDLTTNTTAVHQIYQWISSYDKMRKEVQLLNKTQKKQQPTTQKRTKKNTHKSCMLIAGGHGIGKTVTIEIILQELNYNITHLDINILKNSKNIDDIINKMAVSSDILTIMNNNKFKKMAILVDEIEAITASAEKACITALQKANEQNWYCPIIFISNSQHNKLLSDIRKASFEVKMYNPFPSDMRKILMKIAISEHIKLKYDNVINKIINHSQGDIRRLIFTLQDIKNAYNDKLITMDMIDEYCKMSNKKDVDVDLYKATDELLYSYSSVDNCLRLFETEKVLLPLMMHQNYAQSIIENYHNPEEQHDLAQKISDSLSTGDVIENHIYGDQNWEMQETHGFYTCVVPSYYISEGLKSEPKKPKLEFATDLNKTSIKRINKKNIINTDRCFRNMNINDYIYINKIIRKLLLENKIKECYELLKDYDIKLEHIESLLKIDKIKNSKTSLTSKQKNEFSKYINQ